MKTLSLALLTTLLLSTACSTVKSRIEEKATVFNALPADIQAQIKEGVVNIGFTPDMVYMSMGRPDSIREKTTATSREVIWVYKTRYRNYEGSQFVGYHRSLYFDKANNCWRSYLTPVHQDVYSEKTEELARICFQDAKVTLIEQIKN